MKKLLTTLLTMGAGTLLLLSSCKKNDPIVTTSGGTAGTLSANSTTFVLDKSKLNDTTTIVKFSFSKSNYGFSAAATYTLQIDVPSDNWKTPQTATVSANIFSQGFNTGDFNALMLKLKLPTGTPSQVAVRIQSSLGGAATPIYTNTLTLTVTPFNLISYVYVPGTYQNTDGSKQWIPATADSLVSATSNGIYTGYVYFQGNDNFKITPAKNWNVSYGDAGGGKISTSGGNITGPTTKGLYFVTVDLNQNTISWTYSQTYNVNWSLIGDAAIDWSTDIDMPFNQNANAYQAVVALKTTGGYKFRANHDWGLSLGDVTPVTGQLTSNNGANLAPPATAGNYLVSLTFGNPLLAPSYTVVKQ